MNFSGFPYPIQKTSQGLLSSLKGIDKIKANLICILLTNPGERCLIGSTKIPLPDGSEEEIKDLINLESFWVYSYDHATNSIKPGKAKAFLTAKDAELIEVLLDNDEKIICTPDHLFMLRNGEYKKAEDLVENDSMMPLYRNKNTSGYERVYQPYLMDYRETHLNFVEGTRLVGFREVVHHKDLNKLNNNPDNLQWMTRKDHVDLHKIISNAFMEKFKNDPEFKENWAKKQKEGLNKYYETHDGSRKGAKLSQETKNKLSKNKKEFYETKEGIEVKKILREKALKQFEGKTHSFKGQKHTEETKQKMKKKRPSMLGENNPSKREDVREKLRLSWIKRRGGSIENEKLKNHKIISVNKLNYREDCYDLKVETYHNFAVSAGVFVHNCMLPNFGTPLREVLFDQNDEILAEKVRQMIITSIKKWEPRIVINGIDISSNYEEEFEENNSSENVLYIKIMFSDPENINEVQELQLELPLSTGNN